MLNGNDTNSGTTHGDSTSLSITSSMMTNGVGHGGNGTNNSMHNPSMNGSDQPTPVTGNECKVWKNPCALFRGAEYQRLTQYNSKEPLTFHDMNLSAQEHQTFFSCDLDEGKPEYESEYEEISTFEII